MDRVRSKRAHSESYPSRPGRKWLRHFEAEPGYDSLESAQRRQGTLRASRTSLLKCFVVHAPAPPDKHIELPQQLENNQRTRACNLRRHPSRMSPLSVRVAASSTDKKIT